VKVKDTMLPLEKWIAEYSVHGNAHCMDSLKLDKPHLPFCERHMSLFMQNGQQKGVLFVDGWKIGMITKKKKKTPSQLLESRSKSMINSVKVNRVDHYPFPPWGYVPFKDINFYGDRVPI
jgi:hypothetical protein